MEKFLQYVDTYPQEKRDAVKSFLERTKTFYYPFFGEYFTLIGDSIKSDHVKFKKANSRSKKIYHEYSSYIIDIIYFENITI